MSIILDRLKPTVTREAFDKIECSRCGICCERFYLPLLPLLVDLLPWAGHTCTDGCAKDELAGQHNNWRRMGDWLLDVEPNDDGVTYRCHRFTTIDGVPSCGKYDDRPRTCSEFPYGNPIRGFPGCVWDVELLDFKPLLGWAA